MAFAYFVCFVLIFYLVQANDITSFTCPKSFSCGNLTDLSFPFSLSTQLDSGIMPISGCDAEPFPSIQLLSGGDWYYALGTQHSYTVELGDRNLYTMLTQHNCQAFNQNTSLPDSPSISFEILSVNFHNFFKCSITSNNTPNITRNKNDHFAGYKMYNGCKGFNICYKLLGDDNVEAIQAGNLTANCSLIRLPISSRSPGVFNILRPGFLVEWKLPDFGYKCHYGGGQCKTDKTNKFRCTYPNYRPAKGHQKNNLHAQGLVHNS